MMKIHLTDDFNLDRIADSGQCFRWKKDEDGAYRIIHRDHRLRIKALEMNTFSLSCPEEDYRNIWHDYFDFGQDYRLSGSGSIRRRTPSSPAGYRPRRGEDGAISRQMDAPYRRQQTRGTG